MLSNEMEKELNIQINKELYSAYYYLAMAAWAEQKSLDGVGNFFQVQAQEEISHAQKFYHFVNERGGRVILDAIEKPQDEYKDVKEIFTLALEHEQFVTSRIHKLVDVAIKESDHATKTFLDWFVSEQVEEEASMDAILQKIELVGTTGQGLFMIDAELGGRQPSGGEPAA
jgi:ferritin